ncbi:MAG: DUF883 domain-containing protein [Nevskia sp.]|nr:DUF883 domain-containing protein [Nevskia sp.]
MNDAVEQTGENPDKMKADLRTLIADAEELMRATASLSGEGVRAVREKVAASLKSARATLDEAREKAVVQAKAAAQATDAFVRERPWQAVGVALLIGVVIGLIGGSRRR